MELLLRRGETDIAHQTLRAMAAGGIHDQVGGGFARYSVDARWLVPHFEKMLYDNALLARAYLHGWQVTGDPLLREVTETTLDWMLRELRGPEGGFYVGARRRLGGRRGSLLRLEPRGAGERWPGPRPPPGSEPPKRATSRAPNILVRGEDSPSALPEWRRLLYEVRAQRVWPGLDDKRLTSWNALAIAALAEAGAALGRRDYVDAAATAAGFVLAELREPDGRLLRTWKDGRGRLNAYLEDHAFLLEALLTPVRGHVRPALVRRRARAADAMIARFADEENGGFFETSDDHEQLVARRKDLEDHPIPVRQLGRRLRPAAPGRAHRGARHTRPRGSRSCGFCTRLPPSTPRPSPICSRRSTSTSPPCARWRWWDRAREQLERTVRSGPSAPTSCSPAASPDGVPLLEGRSPVDGRATAYVCERFACRAPVTEPEELERLLS